MSDYLDRLAKDIAESTPYFTKNMPKEETPQHILWAKTVITDILKKEDNSKYYTLMGFGNKFGFSELLVNKLMHYCYNQGYKAGKESGEKTGYDKAREEIIDKIHSLV